MSAESVAADSLTTRRFYDRISRAYDFIADATVRGSALRKLTILDEHRIHKNSHMSIRVH